MRLLCLVAVLMSVMVSGCNQADMMKTITSPEDEAIAKNYIALLRNNQFEQIEKDLDTSLRSPTVHDTLVQMAAMMPAQEPESVKVVGINIHNTPDFTRTNLTFEYQFPGKWLLVNVATQKRGGAVTIVGFNVNPIPDSLENINRFTLVGKSPVHYLTLGMAMLMPIVILYALVSCIRTKMGKRKWLWIIFIVLGIGKFAIDWTTGQWQFMPLHVSLFGAGAVSPPYGSWVISLSLPVGAIVFLLRQRKLVEQAQTS